MGGSYGGYATLAGLTFTPEVFCCGVDIVGPSNLETLLATVPPYWAAFFENLARRVGDPRTEEGRKLLRERSPLHSAASISKPLLIGQGANDPRVKQAEADQIIEAMRAKGLPVTYVLYPEEGHGFAVPENRLSFNAIVEAFLSTHLGGRGRADRGSFRRGEIRGARGRGARAGARRGACRRQIRFAQFANGSLGLAKFAATALPRDCVELHNGLIVLGHGAGRLRRIGEVRIRWIPTTSNRLS